MTAGLDRSNVVGERGESGEYPELRRWCHCRESGRRLGPVEAHWHETICADLTWGAVVLVVAHGNSLRALVRHLDGLGESELGSLKLTVGRPRIYRCPDQAAGLHRPGSVLVWAVSRTPLRPA